MFPDVSVAMIVNVLIHASIPVAVYDHVHAHSNAGEPFTSTIDIPPVSVTTPMIVTTDPVIDALSVWEDTLTFGGVTSGALTIYESVLEAIAFIFQALSENVPVPTSTEIDHEDIVGVTVKVYPVALVDTKALIVPLLTLMSQDEKFTGISEKVARTDIAQVMVPVALDESRTVGGVESKVTDDPSVVPVTVVPVFHAVSEKSIVNGGVRDHVVVTTPVDIHETPLQTETRGILLFTHDILTTTHVSVSLPVNDTDMTSPLFANDHDKLLFDSTCTPVSIGTKSNEVKCDVSKLQVCTPETIGEQERFEIIPDPFTTFPLLSRTMMESIPSGPVGNINHEK